ncbi:MAG: hypothetical protein MJ158_04345, partial [Alphaproteobacteria bacterium]|nr:hypothetical protein [Alphaproteobacteria bacterium]
YALIFKTTHYCNYKCAHCCEDAGPHRERRHINADIICNYISQAIQQPSFSRDVIFTGGEVFSSYKFGDEKYIPQLLTFSLDNELSIDIKTNAGWANTNWGTKIFNDLRDISAKYPGDAVSADGRLNAPKIQMSLSVDRFHPSCIQNNIHVIMELLNSHVCIHVSSLNTDIDYLDKFNKELSKVLHSAHVGYIDAFTSQGQPLKIINNKIVLYSSCGTLFSHGRASDLSDAIKVDLPQYKFVCDGNVLVAFDNAGMVSLGENSGHKIATRWQNPDGGVVPLTTIRRNLYRNILLDPLKIHTK